MEKKSPAYDGPARKKWNWLVYMTRSEDSIGHCKVTQEEGDLEIPRIGRWRKN